MDYVHSYVVFNQTKNQQVKPMRHERWQIGTKPDQWTWKRILLAMKWKETDHIVALVEGGCTRAFRLQYPHYCDQSQFHPDDGADSSANDEDFEEQDLQFKIRERKYTKFLIDTTTSIVSVEPTTS